MPEKEKSRLDREIDEILTKKAQERLKDPIPFSSHPRAPKSRTHSSLSDLGRGAQDVWRMVSRFPLVLAFIAAIAAMLVSDFSTFLALIFGVVTVWAIWWPGLKRLGAASTDGQPDIKYWRGKAYTSQIKDVASRHPLESLKRYISRRQ